MLMITSIQYNETLQMLEGTILLPLTFLRK
jgi:hypothetical protein